MNSSLGDWERRSAWSRLGTLGLSQHHPAVLPSPLAASCQDNARMDDHLTPGIHHGSSVKSWPAVTNQPTPIQAPRLHCPGMLMTGVLTPHMCAEQHFDFISSSIILRDRITTIPNGQVQIRHEGICECIIGPLMRLNNVQQIVAMFHQQYSTSVGSPGSPVL